MIKNNALRLPLKQCLKSLVTFVICLIFCGSWSVAKNLQTGFKNYNAKLQIVDSGTKRITEFFVAIADNDEERSRGLMYVESLPLHCGMLFIMPSKQKISMWMKNTVIPLDMVFIDENDLIVDIKKMVKPLDLELVISAKEANKVLEINAGLVKKFGIKIGNKVRYKL